MFRAILTTQWKWTRGILLLVTCSAFALPLLSIRNASSALEEMNARALLAEMQGFGVFYGLTAAFIGLVIAAMAWSSDHSGRHVYALSLPIDRWRYVAMRFGAGAVTLAPPLIALWVGGLLAVAMTRLPAGLHSHPTALAIRFALASLVAYAIFFAVSSSTKRTAGIILAVLGALLFLEMISGVIGVPLSPFSLLVNALMDWSGTLGVFTGPWMLIDV
jgi:hypothetical protein